MDLRDQWLKPSLLCRALLATAVLVALTLPIAVLTLPLSVGEVAVLDIALASLAVWSVVLGLGVSQSVQQGLRYAALWSRRVRPRGLAASHFAL